jgi:hypothetical protein
MIDIFTEFGYEIIDGGLCTGSAIEAIEFMLPQGGADE